MKVTLQLCCKVVSVVMCVCGLLSECLAAPMDTFHPTGDSKLANPQRLQLFKELRDIIDLEDKVKEQNMKDFMVDNEPQGLMRVTKTISTIPNTDSGRWCSLVFMEGVSSGSLVGQQNAITVLTNHR